MVADADYGSNAAFRRGLERLGLRYGVAIRSVLTMWTPDAPRTRTAAAIATALPTSAWRRVTWAMGTKGPLAARFAAVRRIIGPLAGVIEGGKDRSQAVVLGFPRTHEEGLGSGHEGQAGATKFARDQLGQEAGGEGGLGNVRSGVWVALDGDVGAVA